MPLSGPGASQPRSRGLFDSLRRLGSTLSAVFHSRVELFAREFERERGRAARLALLVIASLFFLALGVLTATLFVIVLFWDSQRLVAIGFITVLYLVIGAGIALYVRHEASRGGRPFSSTLEQLRQDRQRFKRTFAIHKIP